MAKRRATRPVGERCVEAQRARELLQSAYDACYEAAQRKDILAISSGPFSGVNEVLGIIALMDGRIGKLEADLAERG